MIGFMTTVFIYTRAMSASYEREQYKLNKKEYDRQKMLAQIAGRFDDFDVKPEFEEE